MRAEIARLAKRAAASLEKKNLVARTVTIKVRYSDFTTVTRNHTEAPATRDAANLTERALMLLERTDAGKRAVRLLGVGVHGLA
jgi:DNA polymerase-4